MGYTDGDIDPDALDELDELFAIAPQSAFATDALPGTKVSGQIKKFEMRQARDYETRLPATFPDGTPKREVAVRLATEHGERTLYIRAWGPSKQALSAAVRDAKAEKLTEVLRKGHRLTATYHGKKPGKSPNGEDYEYRDYSYEFSGPVPTPPSED